MSVRVRFAPAPTGLLHLGNARTALLNALFAQHCGGEMLLRMDDTDEERCQLAYIPSIVQDLQWLGISWSHCIQQSQRMELYDRAFARLQATGAVYPCYENPDELEAMRQAQREKGLPPRYQRALDVPPPQGRTPYWRFSLGENQVQWTDLIQGTMSVDMAHQSDPVVRRQDGTMSYLLASAIDDVETGITHILRGADHLTNSAIQTLMINALGGSLPTWAHFPLMVNDEGDKFSKRKGSLTIATLREEGWMPMAIVHSLLQLGLSHVVEGDWDTLVKNFSLESYSPSVSQFSLNQLAVAQERLWACTEWSQLPPAVNACFTPEQWLVLRHNLLWPADVHHWHRICSDPSYTFADDPSLPPMPTEFWRRAAQHVSAHSHPLMWNQLKEAMHQALPTLSPKTMAQALRLALTGRAKGPKMDDVVRIIAPPVAMQRLDACAHKASQG